MSQYPPSTLGFQMPPPNFGLHHTQMPPPPPPQNPPRAGFQFLQNNRSLSILAEALRDKAISLEDPEDQLHILEIANDLLLDSVQKRENPNTVALAFKPVMGSMLAATHFNPRIQDKGQSRLREMVQSWGSIFDNETITELLKAMTITSADRSTIVLYNYDKENDKAFMNISTLQAPSSSQKSRLSGLQKVGIFSCTVEELDNFYELYVVDLDIAKISPSTDYVEISPKIQFKSPNFYGACVLDSTFYIFEGNDFEFNCAVSRHNYLELPRSVKKLVLSSRVLDSNLGEIIGIEEFEELTPMKYPKRDPLAVPTLDGKKILVFAATIGNYEPHPPCTFELYDPFLNTWEPLEQPKFDTSVRQIRILVFAFISQDWFMINTDHGLFVVDINPNKRIPNILPRWGNFRRIGWFDCPLITVDCRIIVSPLKAIEVDSGDSHKFTLSDLPTPTPLSNLQFYEAPFPAITLFDYEYDDDKEKDRKTACYTLVSQSQMCDPHDHRLFLSIDALRTDLEKLHTRSVGNLKYILNGREYIFRLHMFLI